MDSKVTGRPRSKSSARDSRKCNKASQQQCEKAKFDQHVFSVEDFLETPQTAGICIGGCWGLDWRLIMHWFHKKRMHRCHMLSMHRSFFLLLPVSRALILALALNVCQVVASERLPLFYPTPSTGGLPLRRLPIRQHDMMGCIAKGLRRRAEGTSSGLGYSGLRVAFASSTELESISQNLGRLFLVCLADVMLQSYFSIVFKSS